MKIVQLLLRSVLLIALLPLMLGLAIGSCWVMGPVGLIAGVMVVCMGLAFICFFVRDHGGLKVFRDTISSVIGGNLR